MIKAKRILAAVLAAATVFTFTPLQTAVTAEAETWEENRLSGLERTLYYKEIDFLKNIIQNGGSGEISTMDTYTLSPSETMTGSNEEVSQWIRKLSGDLRWYIYWNHSELLTWSDNGLEIGYIATENAASQTPVTLRLGWYVSQKFRVDSKPSEYMTLDGSKLPSIRKGLDNADAVLSKYAGLPDYKKIQAYADWIADNNDYNHQAADDDNAASTDFGPWTFNYVFDLDPSTNVVCEGYQRTFEYLMEHSVFSDRTIRSKTVGGTGGGSTHAWNLVTIGNKNYFVDITGYDSWSRDTRFLLGSQDFIDYLIANGCPYYNYEDPTTDFYSLDELKVSDTPYNPDDDKSTGTGKYISWKGVTTNGSQPQSSSDDDDDYEYDDFTYAVPARVTGVKVKNVKGSKIKVTFDTDDNTIWYEVSYTYKGKTHKKDAYNGSVKLNVPKKTKVKVKVRGINWDSDDELIQQKGKWSATKTFKTDNK